MILFFFLLQSIPCSCESTCISISPTINYFEFLWFLITLTIFLAFAGLSIFKTTSNMVNTQGNSNKSKASTKSKSVRFRVATSYIDTARSSVRANANQDILAQIDAAEGSTRNTRRAAKISSIRSAPIPRAQPNRRNTEPEIFIFPKVDIDIPVYKAPTGWADAVRQNKPFTAPEPVDTIITKTIENVDAPSPTSLAEEGSYLLDEQFDIDDLEEERLRRAVVREYDTVYEDLPDLCWPLFLDIENDMDDWYVPAGHSVGLIDRLLGGVYPQNVPFVEYDEDNYIYGESWEPFVKGAKFTF